MSADVFAELSPPYSTIVADPPWSYAGSTYNGRTSPWRSTSTKAYSLMSIEDIAALPVPEIATPDAHLYLWAVNPLMHRAYEVVQAWGFQPDTILTWCKPGPGLGAGFRANTEHVIVARRGTRGNPTCTACGGRARGRNICGCETPELRSQGRSVAPMRPFLTTGTGSWFTASRGAHSAKPPLFGDLIEQMSPGPYLELFSRAPRLGWDSWGNGYEIGAAS